MQSMGGDLRPVHLWVVLADDEQGGLWLETQVQQTEGKIHDLDIDLIPGIFLPDAIAFFALGDSVAQFGDAPQEGFCQCIFGWRNRRYVSLDARAENLARRRSAIGD